MYAPAATTRIKVTKPKARPMLVIPLQGMIPLAASLTFREINVLADESPIRVAVVGVGSFGRNHARVYHELQKQGQGVELVAVMDQDFAQAQAVAAQFGCSAFSSLEELFGRAEAASVAVPTVHHR